MLSLWFVYSSLLCRSLPQVLHCILQQFRPWWGCLPLLIIALIYINDYVFVNIVIINVTSMSASCMRPTAMLWFNVMLRAAGHPMRWAWRAAFWVFLYIGGEKALMLSHSVILVT